MTDVAQTAAAEQSVVHASQIIEERQTNESPRAGHMPEADAPKPEPSKPLSTREAIAKAFDEAEKGAQDKAKAAADDAKAKVVEAEKAPKPEKVDPVRGEGGKFAKAEPVQPEAKAEQGAPEKAAAERGAPEERQSEGRKYSEPPARFLPEARTKWANVPNEVKTEFHRVSQELEGEITKYKQSSERYEQLRQYDETARTNGRDLTESLAKVAEVEKAIARNPIAGLDAVLREIGPRKADGSPLTLLEVAQHIVQNPQAYHSATSQVSQTVQSQPQAQQRNPEIEALRSEINSMKQQAILPEIERFYDAHSITPGSDIENALASVLESGVIEKIYGNGLSLTQRLSEAYRMAGGLPPSRSEPEVAAAPAPVVPQGRPVDPDGAKSIRGAPSAGQTGETKPRFKSNREALEAALAQFR